MLKMTTHRQFSFIVELMSVTIKNTPDSEIKYLNGGILEIITGQDTRILSQVSISTDGSKGHIHNETMVVL